MKIVEVVSVVAATTALIFGAQHGIAWYDQNHLTANHADEARIALAEIDQARDSVGTDSYGADYAKAKATLILLNAKDNHTTKDRNVTSDAKMYLLFVDELQSYKTVASQNTDLRKHGFEVSAPSDDADRIAMQRDAVNKERILVESALKN